MKKYRKKPLEVFAVQWNPEAKNYDEVVEFVKNCPGCSIVQTNEEEAYSAERLEIKIPTDAVNNIVFLLPNDYFTCDPTSFYWHYGAIRKSMFEGLYGLVE